MKNIITKSKIKMLIDIVMSVALFFLMSYQVTEQRHHEIAGAAMFVLFLLHHVMNYRWYITLGRGKYPLQRQLQIIVDFILLVFMLLLMISGIGMSRYIFRFLGFDISASLARSLHMVCSYASFLITGIHIGLHYGMIRGKMRKSFNIGSNSMAAVWISRGIATVVSIYGLYALIERNFISYIILKMHYVFFDFEESVIFYELDLLAIMILMIYIGYYLQKAMIQLQRRRKLG